MRRDISLKSAADSPELTAAQRAYLVRESGVALVVNSVLSLVFATLVVHGRASVPLWGANGMAVDFVPQLFLMTAATTLAVTLLTRKRLRAGTVAPAATLRIRPPRHVLARACLLGAAAVIACAPLTVAILAIAGVQSAAAAAFIVGKTLYGAAFSLVAGPLLTRFALADASLL